MRVAVENHALPVYKKNRIASLLCIFESTIVRNSYIWRTFLFGTVGCKNKKRQNMWTHDSIHILYMTKVYKTIFMLNSTEHEISTAH